VALLHCDFHSHVLGMAMAMDVILPQPEPGADGLTAATAARYPCLYLLHGLSDDQTIWQRRTSIERYVAGLPLAVVMPAAHRSFYTNMRHGLRYWDYISLEVPAVAESLFAISGRREDRFAAGLSMGGYGAFKLALRCPARFAAAGSLSGALDVALLAAQWGETAPPDFRCIFGGEPAAGTDDDLFHLAEQVAATPLRPRLWQCCGTEDFLYGQNTRFRDCAGALGLPLTYSEGPGSHDWGYWDCNIQRFLQWLRP